MTEKRKLVAEIGDKKIYEEDVIQYIQSMDPSLAQQFHSEEGVKQIIDELVRQELLYLDAVDNKFDEEEEFQKVFQNTKESLLKSYAFSKTIEDVMVTDEEIAAFYNNEKDQFAKPAGVRASHILVDTKETADEILVEIKNGAKFEEIAQKTSLCPSKEKGGDLGVFHRGDMVPEFDEAVFQMKEGEISEPVKTQFGFHIIRLDEKIPAREASLEEARDNIGQELLRRKQQDSYLKKIEELSEKYPVKLH